MNRKKIAQLMLAASAVTGSTLMANDRVEATEVNTGEDYTRTVQNRETLQKGQVINAPSSLRVRSEASTASSTLGYLANGSYINIIAENGSWYRIDFNGREGYVHSDYVKLITSNNGSSSENVKKKGKVVNISTFLNVRQYANTNSAILKTLKNGDTFDIISLSGDWYNIKTGNTIGFVYKDYVQVVDNTANVPNTPSTPSYSTGKVINVSSNLRVRSEANTNSSILGYLLNGESVKIISENGSWIKIDYNGKNGYVHRDYIQKTSGGSSVAPPVENKPSTPESTKPEVTTKYGQVVNVQSNLRVRTKPSTSSSVLGYLLNGQRITVKNSLDGWYEIDFKGNSGYVSSDYIKIVESNQTGNYQSVFNEVYSIMSAHIGSPYVWGGTGEMLTTSLINTLKNRYPSQTARGMYKRAEQYVDQGYRAFDCSGILQWSFAQVGIKLGRSTWHQIEDGYEVTLDNIRPGDLLFYSNLQHVGMYVGNGKWIEAPNQNANVRVVNVPWSNIGRARRVIE